METVHPTPDTARPARTLSALMAASLLAASTAASGVTTTTTVCDGAGDAALRRTDPGADGPLNPASTLPDLLCAEFNGWAPFNPAADPYAGDVVVGDGANIFRIRLTFNGLVNPPGPIGLGGHPYDPYRFGPSPLLGFLELDIDRDKDTGGELGGAAVDTFLANAARFGGRPYGSVGERAATSADDYDGNFYSDPQFERSGVDFALTLCGCEPPSIISQSGDSDGVFDVGETWVVRSRFFKRAGGYQEASSVFAGSDDGLYDPYVNLRFDHDPVDDITTVTLVYALNMQGAAALAGQPQQPIDFNVGNHTSVREALEDLIFAADNLPLSGPVYTLTERWEGEDSIDYIDPTDWDAYAVFGTAYASPQPTLYVWTDIGFECQPGDMDGSGLIDVVDRNAVSDYLAATDGGPGDADGAVNDAVQIPDFGFNFSLFDINGDGFINSADLDFYVVDEPADLNGDGIVNGADLALLLGAWGPAPAPGESPADLNNDGVVNGADLALLLGAWG